MRFLIFTGWFLSLSAANAMGQTAQLPIDFDRDIRPILSDRCYFCHGPDSQQRYAGLRLDDQDEALEVIEPGDPDTSELWLRISSNDDDDRMPPPESKLSLTQHEKDLIQRWIYQGAPWKKHWAFEPRQSPTLPEIPIGDEGANQIDRFIRQRLLTEGLDFSPQASAEKLIRRVTFDLTGLPPTLDEIDNFLAEPSAAAYERWVDHLLQSSHYGQRMASDWLDVARYSDTYGYQVDRDRFVWPWRDWVIRAFNQNKPYDEFVVEQLAGDLLPNASQDQILATAFNRLHPQKVEGGSVEEEFRVEYVADRTHTFGTAILGLTLECARCHDHKFDPISQREYYQLFSFFNSVDEAGLYSFFTNSVPTPTLGLVTEDQQSQMDALKLQIQDLNRLTQDRVAAVSVGEKPIPQASPIESVDFEKIGIGKNTRTLDDQSRPAVKLTGDDAVVLSTGNFRRYQPFSVSLSMMTPDVKERAVVFHRSRAWTDAGSRGYQLLIEKGHLSASLIHFWPGNAIRVITKEPIPVQKWVDVAVVYDGSMRAEGLNIFVDGKKQAVDVVRDHLTKSITGGGGDKITIGERFRDRGFANGSVSQFSVFDQQLSDLQVQAIHRPESLDEIRQTRSKGRLSDDQKLLLKQHFALNGHADFETQLTQLKSLREQLSKKQDAVSEIMAMRELALPRPTYVLERGMYDARGESVSSTTPRVLPPMDESLPKNRLGLARWVTSPNHPLTARVAVNHFWQLLFGEGLVRTPEDFGRQGALPTHPELLDWLSNDFVANGWDIKRLMKQIVMSKTYRQSTAVTPDLLAKDPENQWLGRGPSYRLSAEMLRDNVLAVSGLLVDKVGGPPVKPYELQASFKPATPDVGDGLYRRSLYTYWRRTGPAPVMMTLDAAKRDVCRVKRERTSSPLQALAMLNGPQFVEASRALSHRLIKKHGETAVDPMARDLFRTLTSRHPSERELAVIRDLFEQQLIYFRENPAAALAYLSTGKFGDYATTGTQSAWPQNAHDFRLGSTPDGREPFRGEIGLANLYPVEMSPLKAKERFMLGRAPDGKDEIPVASLSNRRSDRPVHKNELLDQEWGKGHSVFTGTADLNFPEAFTLEAWVQPTQTGTGRIWDKITPGSPDGLLLDMHGGLRFICGNLTAYASRAPAVNEWTHVVCAVNLAESRVRFYLNGEAAGGIGDSAKPRSSENLPVLAAWSMVANTLINHDECVTKR